MSILKSKLALTSPFGDPRNTKTWTAVPSMMIQAAEDLGFQVIGIDSSLKNYQKLPYWLLHKVNGLGSNDFRRGRLARNHSADKAQSQIITSRYQKVLHTSTFDLPLLEPKADIEHYLFCDSTWNLWSKYATNMHQYTSPMMQLAEELDRESYSQIKHFFPVSEYVRDNLINYYKIEPERITVVGSGIKKIQPFTGKKDYQKGHILFVAKDRFEDKGGSLLIEGFKIAYKKNTNIKLIIVGREEYKKQFSSIPNVITKAYIPWKELHQLFCEAALFAMPALNEPWGQVYIEALAYKAPILGLNRNYLPEIIQQGAYGFLVDKPEPELIADAILQAFSEPEKLEMMGLAAQKYCLETFSWQKVMQKITNVMFDRK